MSKNTMFGAEFVQFSVFLEIAPSYCYE